MGADQDIHAVNLMEGEPVNRLQPSPGGDLFRTQARKALGCQSDPSRLGE